MNSEQISGHKRLFVAWILGWATAVYLPSLSIALLALSPLPQSGNLFVDTFQIADEVSPAAKLVYAFLFGAFLLAVRRTRFRRRMLANGFIGVVSILLVVALLPESWSRGFGIGLNGVRFEPLQTTIYIFGGFVSGIVFSISEN